MFISLAQSIRQPWKLSLGTTTLKSFVDHTGLWETLEKLDDLEKCIGLMLLVICNDVIKSS